DFEAEPSRDRKGADEDPLRRIKGLLATADDYLDELQELRLLKLFTGERFIGYAVMILFATLLIVAAVFGVLMALHKIETYSSGWPVGWMWWLVGTIGVVIVGSFIVWFVLLVKLRRQLAEIYPPLRTALAEAAALCKSCRAKTEAEYPGLLEENQRKRDKDL